MNNQNKNNGDKAAGIVCLLGGLLFTILLFIWHALFSPYDMNPLSFFFCIAPLVLGLCGAICC